MRKQAAATAADTEERRGRPREQDVEQLALGRVPASVAAKLALRHISRLYVAQKDGRLPMVRVGTYWYVAFSDLSKFTGKSAKALRAALAQAAQ